MSREKHVVTKAIILAAGIGKRLCPVTLDTPKPLIMVNGVRMIDTAINALRINGIEEIYVVVGYLKERFYEWVKGKHGISIIDNPYYDSCNNIASLYVAREYLGNCIIMDGDQLIYNPTILDSQFHSSGYNAVWCEGSTDEWLMDVEDGIVKSCSRTGGKRGWQLYSISRWTIEDGIKLRQQIEYEFERGNRDIYWDDVVMFYHFSDYSLSIKEMKREDILEIDNLEELIRVDNSYERYKKQNGGTQK